MPYVITTRCVDLKDRACVRECPVDCIYEGARALYINPEECIDCGACAPVCPNDAVYFDQEVPEAFRRRSPTTPPSSPFRWSTGRRSAIPAERDPSVRSTPTPLVAAQPPQVGTEA